MVDLWGGLSDPESGRVWDRNTTALVYSATKGVTTTAAHLLAQRGDLDLDAPVTRYWPEFGAAEKGDIPVRWLLTHPAGLPALDTAVPLSDALTWDPMVEALAAQRPEWTPGTAHGYHSRTFGYLVGEVIRRVSGRSVGRYLAEEIAGPLGIDFVIGLPKTERHRVARLVTAPQPDLPAIPLDDIPEQLHALIAAQQDPGSLVNRSMSVTDPADPDFNSTAVQAAEIPSTNGIGTARGLACMYAALIGEVDGTRLLSADTLAAAIAEQASGIDRVLLVPNRYASGYLLPTDKMTLGGPSSFGHPGRGGTVAFADPERGIAFAYITNYLAGGLDPRAADLIAAMNSALC